MILVWKLLASRLSQVSGKWANWFRSLKGGGAGGGEINTNSTAISQNHFEKESTLKYVISNGIFLYSKSGWINKRIDSLPLRMAGWEKDKNF